MPDRSLARRTVVTLVASAALLVAAAGALAAAPPANSAPLPLLSCHGTETVTYQPPLTSTQEPTLVDYAISLKCLGGGVASGESQGSFTVTTSCTSLNLLFGAFSDTYQWNNGRSSTVTYTVPVITLVNGTLVVTDTGTVTSGFDEGAVANETTTLPEPNPTSCAGAGVSQLTGPYILTFG